MSLKKHHGNEGFTFVETAFSIVILAVIFLGSVQYFNVSRRNVSTAAYTLNAWREISNRFEYALALNYTALEDSLTESGVLLTGYNYPIYRTTVVATVDDPADGLGAADSDVPDYKKVTVRIARSTVANVTDTASIFISSQRRLN